MTTSERRQAIIDILCVRKHETTMNIAYELNASRRTIQRDIEVLSLDYPIYCDMGRTGGIHLMEGYRNGRKYLSENQADFLKGLLPSLSDDDKTMMESILKDFVMPSRKN